MDVTQGKLIIGMDLDIDDDNLRFDVMIYNSIFGGSANSKLFQNVREKASLAYTASSSYYRFKNNIFINCGIEIKNYEKVCNDAVPCFGAWSVGCQGIRGRECRICQFDVSTCRIRRVCE